VQESNTEQHKLESIKSDSLFAVMQGNDRGDNELLPDPYPVPVRAGQKSFKACSQSYRFWHIFQGILVDRLEGFLCDFDYLHECILAVLVG
jgi:hypothetical protein